MSKAIYLPENGSLIKHNKMYEVANGQNHKILKGYIVEPHYTILEYIEISGTQYIDTGVSISPENAPKLKTVVVKEITMNGKYALDGCGNDGSPYWNSFYIGINHNGMITYGNGRIDVVTTTAYDGAKHEFIYDARNQKISVNGLLENYSIVFKAPDQAMPFYLGAYCKDSSTALASCYSGKIYSAKIYLDDVLIRDFVPCRSLDGTTGFYEKVESKFYVNAGSGVFVAGAETDEVIEQSIYRLFYSAGVFESYTGDYTITEISDDSGNLYDLYAISDSGQLTLGDTVQVWLCGGGSGGNDGYAVNDVTAAGGGGSGGFAISGQLEPGTYTITVGQGGSANNSGGETSILDSTSTVIIQTKGGAGKTSYLNGNSGGTGGGANRYVTRSSGSYYYKDGTPGTGDGISKYPFGITSLGAHCAGGGAGSCGRSALWNNRLSSGGDGGTNGGTGGTVPTETSSTPSGGAGGEKGGGAGGSASASMSSSSLGDGSAATFWGSGGGGGSALNSYSGGLSTSQGGAGYQGIVYLLVPKPAPSFTATGVSCSGTKSIKPIEINGEIWNLMEVSDSGTLDIGSGDVKVWLCGGGAGGNAASSYGAGGGGAGAYATSYHLFAGSYSLTIGAGGSSSTDGLPTIIYDENGSAIQTAAGGATGIRAEGGSGGTGGGAGAVHNSSAAGGTGDGNPKFPFDLVDLGAHCAGGGGGRMARYDTTDSSTGTRNGGSGGTNGGDGNQSNTANDGLLNGSGASGGVLGGGTGGGYNKDGSNATFYGSGGGGGGRDATSKSNLEQDTTYHNGGAGYPGVAYVLWRESNPEIEYIYLDGVTYGGEGSFSEVEKDGATYNLLTITDSGTLYISRDDAQVWLCGGGGHGGSSSISSNYSSSGGGGGGGGYTTTATLASGEYPVVIGAGGSGTTTIGTITANGGNAGGLSSGTSNGYGNSGNGGNGGSGGGAAEGNRSDGHAISYTAGTGARVSTIPFGLTEHFKPHSAGGGAGTSDGRNGGNGGSNGSNGSKPSVSSGVGGTGGEYGGGNGGAASGSSTTAGRSGTYYGAGGGGGGAGSMNTGNQSSSARGKGYQGVAYILWPKS